MHIIFGITMSIRSRSGMVEKLSEEQRGGFTRSLAGTRLPTASTLEMPMQTHLLIGSAVFSLAFTAAAAANITVYSQPPLFGDGNSFPAEINGGQQADNWTANTTNTIHLFRWWGTTAGPNSAGFFTLRIFSNAGGSPGALLNQFAIGNGFTQTETGNFDFNGRDIFRYEASLGAGFTPTLGATYWFSILNDQAAVGGPVFLWHQGGGGNGSHAFQFNNGGWNTLDGDMAFELVTVPAPGAIIMFGLAALSSRRRRD